MFVFGVQTFVIAFLVKPISDCCRIPPHLRSLFFMWFGGLRFLRKLDFTWQVLLGQLNTLERLVRRRTLRAGPLTESGGGL